VVDDSPEIREMLRAALEYGGHEVEDTSNFQCGLRALETGDYDAVICDGHFPMHAESGPEPLGPELLRRASPFCRIRILHSADDMLSASVRGNGITVLPKCSSLSELLKAVGP
jgi:CheY-like chemotaxis protein